MILQSDFEFVGNYILHTGYRLLIVLNDDMPLHVQALCTITAASITSAPRSVRTLPTRCSDFMLMLSVERPINEVKQRSVNEDKG